MILRSQKLPICQFNIFDGRVLGMQSFSTWSTYSVAELIEKLGEIQRQLNDGSRMVSGSTVGQSATNDVTDWAQVQQTHDSLVVELKMRFELKRKDWELIRDRLPDLIDEKPAQTQFRQSFAARPSDGR
jgi:hypothetical protein